MDFWIVTCIKVLKSDNSHEEAYKMLVHLLYNYWAIIKTSTSTYADLNTFCEYQSKTILGVGEQVGLTLGKWTRLRVCCFASNCKQNKN